MLHPRARTSVSGPRHVRLSAPGWPGLAPWSAAAASSPPAIRRGVRLVLAAGVAAAGVCLILGMTMLAATVGTSGSGSADSDAASRVIRPVSDESAPAAPRQAPGGTSTRRHDAAPPLAGRTIAYFYGASRPARAHLRIATPGSWGLMWAFRCQGRMTGHLLVTERANTAGDGIVIEASGRTGDGTTWAVRDPGGHSLAILSDCPWSIRIALPTALAGR